MAAGLIEYRPGQLSWLVFLLYIITNNAFIPDKPLLVYSFSKAGIACLYLHRIPILYIIQPGSCTNKLTLLHHKNLLYAKKAR